MTGEHGRCQVTNCGQFAAYKLQYARQPRNPILVCSDCAEVLADPVDSLTRL